MTGTHLPVNQHAIHHIHARFMSNVAIGPGGQATLVAPTQSESGIALVTSLNDVSEASAMQQTVYSSPLETSSVDTSLSPSASVAPAPSDPVEVSTTVIVTSEVVETSPAISASPSTTISSPNDSISAPISLTSANLSAPTITSLASASVSDTSIDSSSPTSSLSSSTVSHNSLAAAATSSVTDTSATKEPTLYIGIVLGTIIVIACVAALIAWWLRLRTHSRRRKKSVAVPWANRPESSLSSFTDSDSLEKGEPSNPQQHTWEPRGDRDAGEPKRSKSFLEEFTSPVKRRSLPILGLPSPPPAIYTFNAHPPSQYSASYSSSLLSISPASVGPLQESVAYPLPNHSRPLYQSNYFQPSMSVHPNPPSVRMQFLTDPEFGTPREAMVKPRYLSLDESLKVPWNTEAPSLTLVSSYLAPASHENVLNFPLSLSERHPEAQETVLPEPDFPASVPQSQGGTWSSSIKANLVYAFNAVTKAASGAHSNEEYDKLSPLPSRNSIRNCKKGRKSTSAPIQKNGWVEYFGGELVGKAPTLFESPTLEETDEGRGIVHIRTSFSRDGQLPLPGTTDSVPTSLGTGSGTLMGLEGYRGNDHAFSPLVSSQPSMASWKGSIASHQSTAALVVKKKNSSMQSTGMVRSCGGNGSLRTSRSQRRPKYAYGGEIVAASRRSSVASRAPILPALPSFSKSSSTMSSFSRTSTIRSIMTVLTDREEIARQALIERQRRGT